MKLKDWFRDSKYDHRKVTNASDVITVLNQMGVTGKEIAKVCDISTTIVSRWKSHHNPSLPSYHQIKPVLETFDVGGRIEIELEPVNKAARQYTPIVQFFIGSAAYGSVCAIVWFMFIKPCADHWGECQQLPWYEMPVYKMKKNSETFKEMRLLYREKHTPE